MAIATTSTDTLYRRSDDARAALTALDKARNDALYEIELIAERLRVQTGATQKDALYLINLASDGLEDMLGDIRAGYVNELDEADRAIGAIELQDQTARAW